MSRATVTGRVGRNWAARYIKANSSKPVAPIAAIAMRLRMLTGRSHEARKKKQKAITVIHSAFLILKDVHSSNYLWQPLCREQSKRKSGSKLPFQTLRLSGYTDSTGS